MLVPRIPDFWKVEIVGIGCTDLPETTEDDIIVNVGYAGGYNVPVGRIIEPLYVCNYGSDELDPIDHIFPGCGRYRCYTANEFVTIPCTTTAAIYDMELAKLAKLPHKKLYALKIVSDSLNEKECEAFNSDECWAEVAELLKAVLHG